MKASNLSLPIAEQTVKNKLDELDELIQSEQEQIKGLRDAFINYIAVTKQIIKDLEVPIISDTPFINYEFKNGPEDV